MYRIPSLHLANLLLVVLFAFASAGCERRQHLVEQHLFEFGTLIEITLISDDLPQAESHLGEIERRLQRYRGWWHAWQDSDLTRFNADLESDGRATVPPSLEKLLALSIEYHRASDGLFDPALGKLIAAYGFHGTDSDDTSIDEIRRNPPSMSDLQIEGDIAISRNPHLRIDLGGIAKGYAIALIAEYLQQNGVNNFIVNAGGDMRIAGNRFGRPWRLGIQNPFAPGVVASLEIEGNHSLFTSGNYLRQYRHGDGQRHHIIDPRSGESSRGQTSATVLVADPVRADVAATTLMIDGLRKSRDLALSLGVSDYLLISDTREMLVSRSFFDKLEIRTNWPIRIVN